ncbi:NUDIX hydrolase [Lactobacillaceae bacterium L1_55_11]|nr:NUDIX hydrolase [Lactobacillaceae bacterium L1_55_11]
MPEIYDQKTVYQGKVFKVVQEKIDLENGHAPLTRQNVISSDSATIALINEQNQVLIEQEYRAPIQRYSWALPAGRVNPGEEPLATAARELAEETGFKIAPDQFRLVDQVSLSNGILSEISHIFLVHLAPGQYQQVDRHFDAGEDIEHYQWVDLKTALAKTDGAASHLALLHWQLGAAD